MPKEESFPILLKHIGVTRTTHTSLDVLLGKRFEDYWNLDGEKELSDARTGFTRFILLNERHLMGTRGSGRDFQENKQRLAQTMYGQICGRKCLMQRKQKAKQRWAIEKQLRGKDFIEPDNEEFKLSMKAAR